ncbi:XisI protein [Roseofilum sp. BLCC_M154]|uniref:XisI protein n=1 Tax=Roseofilum acuticapitatum BLCC-M154 TaxID=3022444 RepID=A0ABT7AUX3_9CYAN|nr:XisI protein [Roseofilum acuticapitatum]MDJ1170660.1 XisI protein [Roseofilum acuticapitatum BLCC-M154]
MDKLEKYRQIVQDLLTEYVGDNILGGVIESTTVFDLKYDRYLLVDFGWNGQRRIYNCLIHLEIRAGKIWIQRNQTDCSLTDELLDKGVIKEDIVLGLQPPNLRKYTGCGLG